MEKEINYDIEGLRLNLHFEESPASGLERLLEKTLAVLSARLPSLLKHQFSSVEVNLNIVDDEQIREINLEYRQKDKSTDVLSFPLQENVRRGEYDDFDGHLELGDIFVATGVCQRQADEHGITFDEEFVHLFTHGFLHLCGYDHEESDEEDELMRGLESELMSELASKRN